MRIASQSVAMMAALLLFTNAAAAQGFKFAADEAESVEPVSAEKTEAGSLTDGDQESSVGEASPAVPESSASTRLERELGKIESLAFCAA